MGFLCNNLVQIHPGAWVTEPWVSPSFLHTPKTYKPTKSPCIQKGQGVPDGLTLSVYCHLEGINVGSSFPTRVIQACASRLTFNQVNVPVKSDL